MKHVVSVRFGEAQLAIVKEAAEFYQQPYSAVIREQAVRGAQDLLGNLDQALRRELLKRTGDAV